MINHRLILIVVVNCKSLKIIDPPNHGPVRAVIANNYVILQNRLNVFSKTESKKKYLIVNDKSIILPVIPYVSIF